MKIKFPSGTAVIVVIMIAVAAYVSMRMVVDDDVFASATRSHGASR